MYINAMVKEQLSSEDMHSPEKQVMSIDIDFKPGRAATGRCPRCRPLDQNEDIVQSQLFRHIMSKPPS